MILWDGRGLRVKYGACENFIFFLEDLAKVEIQRSFVWADGDILLYHTTGT